MTTRLQTKYRLNKRWHTVGIRSDG